MSTRRFFKFIYEAQELSGGQVLQVIKTIKAKCRGVIDRTQARAGLLSFKTDFPIKVKMPSKALRVELSLFECELKKDAIGENLEHLLKMALTNMRHLSTGRLPIWWTRPPGKQSFMIQARHTPDRKRIVLRTLLVFPNELKQLRSDQSALLERVVHTVEALKLPLKAESDAGGFWLKASSGAAVEMYTLYPDTITERNPEGFDLIYNKDGVEQIRTVMERVLNHPELKCRRACLGLDFDRGTPDRPRDYKHVVKALNAARLPAKSAEVTLGWYIPSPEKFTEMAKMAVASRQEQEQALLGFKVDKDKELDMDIVVTAKGDKYRLYFSSDSEGVLQPLTELLGLKLKEFI